MYKIMLADDEGVALDALRIMITTHFHEMEENIDIRMAQNSSQMSDIYQKYHPDILFLNIQMTGLHGIFSIRELHAFYENCLFIVVSYSRKTDYKREGFLMGIRSYLTKPLKREKVISSLDSAFHELDYHKKHQIQEQLNKESFDTVIPVIENGFISELFFPEQFHQNLSLYTSLLDIHAPYGWIMALKFSQITDHGTMCNPIGSLVQLQGQFSYFRTIIKAFFPSAIIGPVLANHIFILIPADSIPLSESEEAFRRKRSGDMGTQLFRKLNLHFKLGLGGTQPLINLPQSLKEACEAVEHWKISTPRGSDFL